MDDSSKALLVGAARGALRGALIGVGLIGLAGVATLAATVGLGGVSVMAGVNVVVGFTTAIFGSMATPIFPMVVGGSAAMGGLYKGVSDFADRAETNAKKAEITELAKTANTIKLKPRGVAKKRGTMLADAAGTAKAGAPNAGERDGQASPNGASKAKDGAGAAANRSELEKQNATNQNAVNNDQKQRNETSELVKNNPEVNEKVTEVSKEMKDQTQTQGSGNGEMARSDSAAGTPLQQTIGEAGQAAGAGQSTGTQRGGAGQAATTGQQRRNQTNSVSLTDAVTGMGAKPTIGDWTKTVTNRQGGSQAIQK